MKKVLQFFRDWPMVWMFAAAILILTVLDVIYSDAPRSEMENRELAQRPALTWSGLMDLSFSEDYDTYLSDQFVGRDGWITLKSRYESLLGKTENNGVLYGSDGYLFEKLFTYDTEKVEKNLDYLEKFAAGCPYPLTVMMIPNSYQVYWDKLPFAAQPVDQAPIFAGIYDRLSPYADCVDLLAPLTESETPYLYYRTDHHWTTEGAYVAYTALCDALGITPFDRTGAETRTVENFRGTYYSKSKAANVQPDTITYYPLEDVKMVIRSVTEKGEFYTTEYDTLYNEAQFATYDKYAAFLYSNNDLTVITNTNPSDEAKGKSICVLKDSYGNSFIPYLTRNYETVSVIDIRHFNDSLSGYLANTPFDRVVVMYNFSTFNTENIAKISY